MGNTIIKWVLADNTSILERKQFESNEAAVEYIKMVLTKSGNKSIKAGMVIEIDGKQSIFA